MKWKILSFVNTHKFCPCCLIMTDSLLRISSCLRISSSRAACFCSNSKNTKKHLSHPCLTRKHTYIHIQAILCDLKTTTCYKDQDENQQTFVKKKVKKCWCTLHIIYIWDVNMLPWRTYSASWSWTAASKSNSIFCWSSSSCFSSLSLWVRPSSSNSLHLLASPYSGELVVTNLALYSRSLRKQQNSYSRSFNVGTESSL